MRDCGTQYERDHTFAQDILARTLVVRKISVVFAAGAFDET